VDVVQETGDVDLRIKLEGVLVEAVED